MAKVSKEYYLTDNIEFNVSSDGPLLGSGFTNITNLRQMAFVRNVEFCFIAYVFVMI